MAAPYIRSDEDALSDPIIAAELTTYLCNGPDYFMARHPYCSRSVLAMHAAEDAQVCRTDAGTIDPDHSFSRRRRRYRPFFEPQILRAVVDRCDHALASDA
jgi:hypothetical protein